MGDSFEWVCGDYRVWIGIGCLGFSYKFIVGLLLSIVSVDYCFGILDFFDLIICDNGFNFLFLCFFMLRISN